MLQKSLKLSGKRNIYIELTIERVGSGWAGSIVGWAKTGSGQNWPDFFGPKF